MFINVKGDNSGHFLQKEGQIWNLFQATIAVSWAGNRTLKLYFWKQQLNSFKSSNFPLFELRTYPACKGVNMARFGVFIGG